jgi:hypothetical protein
MKIIDSIRQTPGSYIQPAFLYQVSELKLRPTEKVCGVARFAGCVLFVEKSGHLMQCQASA